MNIQNQTQNTVYEKGDKLALTEKLDLYSTVIELSPQVIYVLDKNKNLVEAYNTNKAEKIGILSDHVKVGKNLLDYANDTSLPFSHVCVLLDTAIDKVWETETPIMLEYKILDSYLQATVTKMKGERTLILVQNITALMHRLQKIELDNNKELAMALTVGGLTSWSYDVKTKMLSSLHQNNTIGAAMPLDIVISRTKPEYRQDVIKMFDDIIDRRIEKSEITIKNMDLNGNWQWTNIHAIAHQFTPEGDVAVIMGSQKNVTNEYEYVNKINNLNKNNELILNNIKSALVYLTPDYKVVWNNVSKVFGDLVANKYYKPNTYCYLSLNRDKPCENCIMKRAIQSHQTESKEFTTAEGITVEINANPILVEDGTVEGVVLKIDDITERIETIRKLQTAQQEASAASRLLYTILNNLPSSIFVKDVDDDYRYILSNKKLCQQLGMSENDIVGKTDYEIFPTKEEAERYRKDDAEVIACNQTKVINKEMVVMKGNVVPSYTIKTPLINVENNNKKFLVGISTDMTEQYKAYQELEIAKKKAEESDRLKSAFLANMSHEIRTPLNAIVGFSELMETCDNAEEKTEYMRIISTNNELLLRLINDILDLSKLDSGIAMLHVSRFDLVPFFNELAAVMRQRITNPNVEFITVNPYQSCIIETDKVRMSQVWNNFMTNAIKYTVSGYIKMGYEYVNDGIKLYVEDTGIGIPKEKQYKLFQRFEKLDSFAQGTGLGLSICKAITELGGGEIGFESEEDKGALFWSWKPLKAEIIQKTESEEIVFPKTVSYLNMADVEQCLKGRNCKILVAEDIDVNYLLVKSLLKEFDISRAVNGAEAVEKVKNEQYDVVLMDIKMPVMDGIEATREIRKFNKNIIIIALTAHISGADKQEALEAGCNHFLTKPTNKMKLFEAFIL